MARRDLGLYLYDNNNRPARDAQGRLIVLDTGWGIAEQVTLNETDTRWVDMVAQSSCATIDPTTIARSVTLASAAGQMLAADTVYEVRLMPLLLHEDFSEDLAGWQVVGGQGSSWKIRGHKPLLGYKATASGKVVTLDGSPDLSALDPQLDVIILQKDTPGLRIPKQVDQRFCSLL